MANVKKRNTSKKSGKSVKTIFLIVALCSSVYMLYASFNEILETKDLKEKISIATIEKEKLDEKKTKLNKDKKNLENPEYVLRYARGKYLVTKDDGEQVFRLPDEEETKDTQ